jgi:hypothetical protein
MDTGSNGTPFVANLLISKTILHPHLQTDGQKILKVYNTE